MSTPRNVLRAFSIVLTATMVASLLLPVAAAELGGDLSGAATGAARSVGRFDVAPRSAGVADAQGAVTSATVSEFTAGASGTGIIRDYRVLDTAVIDTVNVAGFQATKSLAGQGTATLTLEGNNAIISAFDNINSLLVVQNRAAGALQVVVGLAAGVTAQAETAQSAKVAAENHIEGHFVVVNTAGAEARGTIDAAQAAAGSIRANLQQGEALVFRATPRYDVSSEAQAKIDATTSVIVDAMAAGDIAGEVTSEFRGAASLFAEATYDRALRFASDADVRGRVETTLRAAAGSQGSTEGDTVAYDLDYPDLPARSEDNVAVYVNGVLASRADAAADVVGRAQGATYHASSVEGRTLVLVNTGASATATAQKTITLVAVPSADLAAETLAQLNAQLGVTSDVEGEFKDYVGSKASGDVAGEFASFFVSKADGTVHDYALLEQGADVFESIEWEGQGRVDAALDAATSAKYDLKGRVTDVSFHDHVVATIVAKTKADAVGRYELAQGAQADFVDERIVEISNGFDVIGHLVLVEDKSVDAGGNSFHAGAAGEIVAQAKANSVVVFRSVAQGEAAAQARLVAEAMAKGDLASEVNLGVVGNAVETTDVEYSNDVDVSISKAVRGEVLARVLAAAGAETRARAMLLNSDRASLTATSPNDIAVFVKGEAATQVESAAEAYATAAASGQAAFAVTGGAGASARQVLVVVPSLAAGTAADVLVKSTLQARSQQEAAVDLFGDLQLDSTTGAATGAIVDFVAKAQASAILDYTVTTEAATTTVFDAVVVGDGAFDIASGVEAPSLRFVNPEATLEIFDTTSALMQITAQADTLVTYDVAAGIEAVAKSDTLVMLNDVSGGQSSAIGAIVLTKADGSAATSSALDTSVAGQVHAQLEENARAVFHAYSGFEAELDEADKAALAEAMAAGHVAGQVIFSTKAAAAAASTATLTGHATMELVQGVDIVTQTASATELHVLVDSVQEQGRTVILSLDPRTIEGIANGDALLEIDGRAVAQAESYADAVDPTDDGGADEYYLHTTDSGHQLLVSLAHFSTRSITLHTPEATSIFVYTTIGLGLVVVGQALYPRIKKKW